MNGIERLRKLVAAGEKASPGKWWVGKKSDKWGWGRICAKDVLDTARLKSSMEVQDEPSTCTLAEFNRYIRQNENHAFVTKAANARQAIIDVLALVEAVGVMYDQHPFALTKTADSVYRAYEKLTSADAQEVRE